MSRRPPSTSWNSTSEVAEIPPQHRQFEFVGTALSGHELRLHYALTGGPDPDRQFCEVLDLPADLPPPNPLDPAHRALLHACHLSFGVSYYKAALPPELVVPSLALAEVPFWDLLYSEGLGEFYFRNGLPIPASPGFAAAAAAARRQAATDGGASGVGSANAGAMAAGLQPPGPRAVAAADQDRHGPTLVLIGGGKDSALVAEIVRATGVSAAALALGDSPWMERSAGAAGLALHRIRRRIDPQLLDLNRQGAWNGHVPISACIAAVATLVARAAGFSEVLAGNERGADDANLVWQGRAVNHQWSKSSRFEAEFQAWCRRFIGPWPRYASLLRPLSEIRIAERFARCPAQHANFTSCNRNFRQDAASRPARWCGECAKCVFVSLILLPHLDAAAAQAIFGSDVLADPHNRPHLEALLGLGEVKPWDCVGTPRECWLSLLALARQHRLPAGLADLPGRAPAELQGAGFAAAWEEELATQPAATLGREWTTHLEAYLARP